MGTWYPATPLNEKKLSIPIAPLCCTPVNAPVNVGGCHGVGSSFVWYGGGPAVALRLQLNPPAVLKLKVNSIYRSSCDPLTFQPTFDWNASVE